MVRWTYRHTGGEDITSVGVYYSTTSDSSRHSLSDDPDADLGGVGLINRQDSIPLPEAGLTYQFSVSASNDRGTSEMVDCPPLSLSVGMCICCLLSLFVFWLVSPLSSPPPPPPPPSPPLSGIPSTPDTPIVSPAPGSSVVVRLRTPHSGVKDSTTDQFKFILLVIRPSPFLPFLIISSIYPSHFVIQ